MSARAHDIIKQLGLQPHPEGGYFAEVYRSEVTVTPADDRSDRPSLTAIHFLLVRGDHSKWHALRSDEVWHHLEGDPLELFVVDPESMEASRNLLGPAAEGQDPVRVVPANHWQAARTLGDYTLVGCTVGPGFVFEDFMLIRDDAHAASTLIDAHPDLARLL